MFRTPSGNATKGSDQDTDKKDEANSDPKSSTNFSALRSFMTGRGRKSSNDPEVTKAVYATRPTNRDSRRHSCKV